MKVRPRLRKGGGPLPPVSHGGPPTEEKDDVPGNRVPLTHGTTVEGTVFTEGPWSGKSGRLGFECLLPFTAKERVDQGPLLCPSRRPGVRVRKKGDS